MTIVVVMGRFCHGLVFFTLGLTVSFLHFRRRRISLAQHLTWLGWFAICEALYAWTALFAMLVPSVGSVSPVVSPILLALAYTFLLGFGIQTLMSEEVYQARVRTIFVSLCGLWLVPYTIAAVAVYPNWESLSVAETLIRYGFALPGGILTAVGFWRQSHRSLDAVLLLRILPYLRVTAVAMVLFGVLNVVLVPPLSRLLNVDLMGNGAAEWAWAFAGVAITSGFVGSLTTIEREIEQWVEGVERLQMLAEDRERIGRELHDGIIQSIYAAGLLLESILPVIPTDPERAQAQLGRVMDSLNNTIQDVRRYIFELRSDMSDEDLPAGIEHLLRDFRINTLLETEFEFTGEITSINSTSRRRHVFQIVREALTNTAKHARARWVSVQLDYGEENLELMISDDGIGMEQLLVSKGYGLRNIRERARLLGGTLRIESAPGAGVTYHLTIPYT